MQDGTRVLKSIHRCLFIRGDGRVMTYNLDTECPTIPTADFDSKNIFSVSSSFD